MKLPRFGDPRVVGLFALTLFYCTDLLAQGAGTQDTLYQKSYTTAKGTLESDIKGDIEQFLKNREYTIESSSPLIISKKEDIFILKKSFWEKLKFWQETDSKAYPYALEHNLEIVPDDRGRTYITLYSFSYPKFNKYNTDSTEVDKILRKSRDHAKKLSRAEWVGIKEIAKKKKE